MKLPPELRTAVDLARETRADEALARRALTLVDLTALAENEDATSVAALCARAQTPDAGIGDVGAVAAVCVWPRFVAQAKAALAKAALARDGAAGTPVKIATVVNFPSGEGETGAVVGDIRQALADGADEIDVVFPYRAFIAGERSRPSGLIRACRQACGDGVILKVILESGAFPDPDLLTWAARDVMAAGADFLKTSTGKSPAEAPIPGATLEAAALLLDVLGQSGRPVGFKASGGIRQADQAAAYLDLADRLMGPGWATPARMRFGASGLLDALLERIQSYRGETRTGQPRNARAY